MHFLHRYRNQMHEVEDAAGETQGLVQSDDDRLLAISDVHVRHAFLRKVYGILGSQLLVTSVISGLVYKYGDTMVAQSPALAMTLIFLSVAASIGMMFTFMCCKDTMRRSPTNYIILLAFTLAEGVVAGFICLRYSKESVLVTLAITAFIVVALSIFACQTKVDFSGYGPYLFSGMMVFFALSFIFMIAGFAGLNGTKAMETAHLIYAAAAALLFSAYIVFDTQLIVGGKHHSHQFSIDDYAMAAITLYIDILQLFLHMLQIVGVRRD